MSDTVRERGQDDFELLQHVLSPPQVQPAGEGESGTGARHGRAPARRRRRGWLIALGVLLALAGLTVGAVWYSLQRAVSTFDQSVERFADPFGDIPTIERPAVQPGAEAAVNVLLLGSDSRVSAGDPSSWAVGGQRTDAIMVVHLPANRQGAYIVSIPRDSWVTVPGRGQAKINAGFSYGGPALMVRTVEKLTGLRIDHVAILDFEGFKRVTDALGGVDIKVAESTRDERGSFEAGLQHMNGETALRYVRQRKGLPGGDLDRARRQQNWLRAVMKQLRGRDAAFNVVQLNAVLDTLGDALATDENFTTERMRELIDATAGVGAGQVFFLMAPVKGFGTSADGQSIVLLSDRKGGPLWTAMRTDRMREWMEANHPEVLSNSVR